MVGIRIFFERYIVFQFSPRPSADTKMLGEMMFGSVAMSYQGSSIKVHSIRSVYHTCIPLSVHHSLSLPPFIPPFLHPSISSPYTSTLPSPHPLFTILITIPLSLAHPLSLHPHIPLFIPPYIPPSPHPSLHPSLHPFIPPFPL